MSARLNMIENPIIPWKGKTFTQITSRIVKNNTENNIISSHDIISKKSCSKNSPPTRPVKRPLPLKIYRKEIVTGEVANCSKRVSIKINDIDMPNGTINNTSISNPKDLVMTLDNNLVNNRTEDFGKCLDPNVCVADNARRRVRSGGMIKRQFDITKNNDSYYTSTNQYLVSRNRKFDQNQYNYIRLGDSMVKPGDSLSVSNVYSANGINHCQEYFISQDVSFQYQWVDASNYQVDISRGHYKIEDVNNILKKAMDNNFHYLTDNITKSHIYFLNITYNTYLNAVELQVTATLGNINNYTNAGMPKNSNGSVISNWAMPTTRVVPGFKILSNVFQQAIGFNAGNYPSSPITTPTNTQTNLTNQTFTSAFKPGLQPLYVPIYYKPNNPQFAQQGGVTSSSLILRKKYNTITKNTNMFRQAYGINIDNAVAYGVGDTGYTIKDKIGYPNKKTPVFSKYKEEPQCIIIQ